MNIIETERLILRTWKTEDADPYYHINQDPLVIEFLRGPLTMEQVTDFIAFMNKQSTEEGYALWAVEEKSSNKLIGSIGIDRIKWEAPFSPRIEIAWRLGSQFWGKGYATEGAKATINYGFTKCRLEEIVAITVPANVRSIRVMEKIGMMRDFKGDFAHPRLPLDHPLSKHILYRIKKPWSLA